MLCYSERGQLEAAIAGLERSWNRHDADAFANGFSVHGTLINALGDRLVGRESIARFYRPLFATIFRVAVQRFALLDVTTIDDTVTLATMSWHLQGEEGPSGAPISERWGRAHMVFVCIEGTWLAAMMHVAQTGGDHFRRGMLNVVRLEGALDL
ncbi:MAG TPA: SgcJ/EcaC family oxidoreductase [Candidatus Baltobacteraceae bacterium]|nr:SgcJ/EcaC family oxidoreductase [Candidatus Baltobacteraceae bacterium]